MGCLVGCWLMVQKDKADDILLGDIGSGKSMFVIVGAAEVDSNVMSHGGFF